MTRFVVSAVLAVALFSGCSSGQPAACGHGITDLDEEPSYSADYLHRWSTADGCDVRLDVLMTRRGDDACGGSDVADILMGTPLGRPHDSTRPRIYIKDPENALGDTTTANAFDEDTSLPKGAVDTGFRQGDVELWTDPKDDAFVYLVGESNTEAWPLDESPPGCE